MDFFIKFRRKQADPKKMKRARPGVGRTLQEMIKAGAD
jgi:hypothetical protein